MSQLLKRRHLSGSGAGRLPLFTALLGLAPRIIAWEKDPEPCARGMLALRRLRHGLKRTTRSKLVAYTLWNGVRDWGTKLPSFLVHTRFMGTIRADFQVHPRQACTQSLICKKQSKQQKTRTTKKLTKKLKQNKIKLTDTQAKLQRKTEKHKQKHNCL